MALLGRSRGRHASDKLASAAAAFAAVALLAGLAFVGGATPPPTLIVAVAVGAGAAGYLVPDVLVRRDARRRRDEFRHALAAYLDLVAAAMAGGAHANQALHSVAELSDTDTFLALRRCLEAARRANTSPWAALAAFGTERALTDLEELTASLALVEHDGALVRESLGAKARSMRDRELADAQTQAETASERMSIPTVLLMAGFVALVGYPALSRVLTL
ncbi:MAG TPA: type II secretion system F family protein [Acidimicrobiales bacterium]|nr:type II secretion system F family protein [Acidimicrobiales bacterium]